MNNTDSINLLGIRASVTTLIVLHAMSEQFKLGMIDKDKYYEFLKDLINTCSNEFDALRLATQNLQ